MLDEVALVQVTGARNGSIQPRPTPVGIAAGVWIDKVGDPTSLGQPPIWERPRRRVDRVPEIRSRRPSVKAPVPHGLADLQPSQSEIHVHHAGPVAGRRAGPRPRLRRPAHSPARSLAAARPYTATVPHRLGAAGRSPPPRGRVQRRSQTPMTILIASLPWLLLLVPFGRPELESNRVSP